MYYIYKASTAFRLDFTDGKRQSFADGIRLDTTTKTQYYVYETDRRSATLPTLSVWILPTESV